MPDFSDSTDWLRESSLLLQARPTTARVTTTYSLSRTRRMKKKRRRKEGQKKDTKDSAEDAKQSATENTDTKTSSKETQQPPDHATIVLKTFDPVSGVCLRYRTNRGAEVGRLITGLGGLGRCMAGLPSNAVEAAESAAIVDGDVETADAEKETTSRAQGKRVSFADPVQTRKSGGYAPAAKGAETQQQKTGGGGGAKKKKKGRK
ncbi:MAG: hypothetical protein M1831_004337 [Alyxoria varia]|nr:MAG: hypothetical protein M1831_004337 [Alyxoria varia]